MNKSDKIYVAGHAGLVGSAVIRRLKAIGFTNIVTRTRAQLDLTSQQAVQNFFADELPQHVILAAAKVGGILANATYPADFIRDNLLIQTNVIHQSYVHGVEHLLFLGSSCIYPRDCPQPMREEYLLTGPLEKTNSAYALAKIAGIEMCHAYNSQYGARYLCVMPTNLYGPGDNFDPEQSHVLPGMIRKFHEGKAFGKAVTLWGTGSPRREFLHSDDMADACLYIMDRIDGAFKELFGSGAPPLINIGCGEDMTIRELADMIREIVGYQGSVQWDSSKPDGTPRKLLDTSLLTRLGWQPKIHLREGVADVYEWFKNSALATSTRG